MVSLLNIKANPNKKLFRRVGSEEYARYPIKTELITPRDDIKEIVIRAVKDKVESGDVVGVSEKATSISQGRAYHRKKIKPNWLARFLVKFVTKSDRGIGISSPETFQLAIDECGYPRIIIASIIGGLGKLIGIRGLFYHIAGNQARLIDGAAEYVMPPYNEYVSKGPEEPDRLARELSQVLRVSVTIIDINDYGGVIVGSSERLLTKERRRLLEILKDNPLGQSSESTPIVIIRKRTE